MVNLSWAPATTPTGFLLLESHQTRRTFLESSPMSTYVFFLYAFFFAKILLIIGTSVSFLFSITIYAIIS